MRERVRVCVSDRVNVCVQTIKFNAITENLSNQATHCLIIPPTHTSSVHSASPPALKRAKGHVTHSALGFKRPSAHLSGRA